MIDFQIVLHSSRKRKDGSAQVKILATQKGKRTFLGTGVYIQPNRFLNGRIINHPNATRLNAELSRQLYAVQSWALDQLRKNGRVTTSGLRSYLKSSGKCFVDFALQSLESDHLLKASTKRKYKVTINHIIDFDKKVELDGITSEWVEEFDAYLASLDLIPKTRNTIHKNIRRFLNQAAKVGLIDKNSIPPYRLKEQPADRCALNEKEVTKLEKMTFQDSTQYLEKVRDMFLFSCYTGLRFQDLIALNARSFRNSDEGLELHFRAKKTGKLLTLPLEIIFDGKPEELARKYLQRITKGKELDIPIFKEITNQYANRCIREIALMAGIYKKVTMHVGRHTFATQMATKIPVKLLQDLLQHSNIETTMIYVHLSNKTINDELKKAFTK